MNDQTVTIGGIRRCGRPTKTGNPCRTPLTYRAIISCSLHRQEGDDQIEQAYERGAADTRQDRDKIYDRAKEAARYELQRESLVERQRSQEAERFRTHVDGAQIVQVDGYTYRWDGQPQLQVGDQVVLPQNWVSQLKHGPGPFAGRVSTLGSSYQGPMSSVIRLDEPSPRSNASAPGSPAPDLRAAQTGAR